MPRNFGLHRRIPGAARSAVIWTAGVFEVLIALLLIVGGLGYASGQERPGHAMHHASYQSWVNKDGKGCCDNQDCRPLDSADNRTSNGFQEVRIEGVWCPVLAKHYLKSGNVPDASTSHVCWWSQAMRPGLSPCERLLCFQPEPLS